MWGGGLFAVGALCVPVLGVVVGMAVGAFVTAGVVVFDAPADAGLRGFCERIGAGAITVSASRPAGEMFIILFALLLPLVAAVGLVLFSLFAVKFSHLAVVSTDDLRFGGREFATLTAAGEAIDEAAAIATQAGRYASSLAAWALRGHLLYPASCSHTASSHSRAAA